MPNWFERNPFFSVFTYTSAVAALTWAAIYFVVDENKIALYQARAENAESETQTYKAKISVLESEVFDLRATNERYLDWLSMESTSFPALASKIEELESSLEIALLQAETSKPTEQPRETPRYSHSNSLRKGESYVDPLTTASLGVQDVNPDYTIDGMLYLPSQGNKRLTKTSPGTSWHFDLKGRRYKLSLDAVNYVGDTARVSVMDITDRDQPIGP